MRSVLKRILSSTLCAAMLLTAPGIPCYQALAGGMEFAPKNAVKPGLSSPIAPLNEKVDSLLNPQPAPGGLTAPGLTPAPPTQNPAPIADQATALEPLPVARTQAPLSSPDSDPGKARNPKQPPHAPTLGALSETARQTHDALFADPSSLRIADTLAQFYQGEGNHIITAELVPENPDTLSQRLTPGALGAQSPFKEPAQLGLPIPPPAAPRSSLMRSLKIGFLAAGICVILTAAISIWAQNLGYEFHPNYRLPFSSESSGPGESPSISILSVIVLNITASVIAPIAEETIFRGGLMGTLSWLGSKIKNWSILTFWLPALASSAVFVVIHETADFVLIGSRMLSALIWSRVYHEEGLMASIATHGFHNAMLLSFLSISALSGTLGLWVAIVAGIPLALAALIWTAWSLIRQQPKLKAGYIVPYALTSHRTLPLVAILMLANSLTFALFGIVEPFWGIACIALLIYGVKKWEAEQSLRAEQAMKSFHDPASKAVRSEP